MLRIIQRRIIKRFTIQIVSLALESYERSTNNLFIPIIENNRVAALVEDLIQRGKLRLYVLATLANNWDDTSYFKLVRSQ